MESKAAVLQALQEGKILVSDVTQMHYRLIDGKLHTRHGEKHDWNPSGLTFENPASWLNLRE
jgi:hypothetical protein